MLDISSTPATSKRLMFHQPFSFPHFLLLVSYLLLHISPILIAAGITIRMLLGSILSPLLRENQETVSLFYFLFYHSVFTNRVYRTTLITVFSVLPDNSTK